MDMIYVGIDVTKNKHDCCILGSSGTVIREAFTFSKEYALQHGRLIGLDPYSCGLIKVLLHTAVVIVLEIGICE